MEAWEEKKKKTLITINEIHYNMESPSNEF